MERLDLRRQHLSTKIFKSYITYIQQNYPAVDLHGICRDAGLELEYLIDENNWVSVIFDQAFTDACIRATNDEDLPHKVGKSALSKDFLGPTLHFLLKNIISTATLCKNVQLYTSLMNKVSFFKLEKSEQIIGYQRVTFSLNPKLELLDKREILALQKNMPNIISNTNGYFTAIPTLKGKLPARVNAKITDSTNMKVVFEVDFLKSTFSFQSLWDMTKRFKSIAVSFFTICFMYYSEFKYPENLVPIASCAILIISVYHLWSRTQLSNSTQETLNTLDLRYQELQKAKESLQLRFIEAELLRKVSNSLLNGKDHVELLSQTCKLIVELFDYDRVVILIADEKCEYLEYGAAHGKDARLPDLFKNFKLPINIQSQDPLKVSNSLKNNAPFLIEDAVLHLSTLASESADIIKAINSRSFCCVPIISDQYRHGVILVDYYESEKQLGDSDLNIISAVCKQLAVALDRENAVKDQMKVLKKSSKFVPWSTLKLLNYNSIMDVKIGDHFEVQTTFLFCDLRDFTKMCENMSTLETMKFINSYFSWLAPIVHKHNGSIDKFIGDCIMALFSTPEDGVRCGYEMLTEIRRYNELHRSGGSRQSVEIGIGIHTGLATFGPVGFDGRIELTALGDAVNTASRLQDLTKAFGAKMLLSKICLDQCKTKLDKIDFRPIGFHQIRGKKEPLEIVEALEGHTPKELENKKIAAELLAKAAKHLCDNDYENAYLLLESLSTLDHNDKKMLEYLKGKILSIERKNVA